MTRPKAGIPSGLHVEMTKSRRASQNPNIEANCYLSYPPQKVYKVCAKVSSATWVPKATIMPPGGQKNDFLAITETRRNGMSYKIPIKLVHCGYYP